jgi:hypothetical protein
MTNDLVSKLVALVEVARSGRCDDVVHGDTCGACVYCLAWALDDDWAEQLQPPKVEVCPHCGRDKDVCNYMGEHIAE